MENNMPNGIKSEKALEFIKKSFNVKDKYKNLTEFEIKEDLKTKLQSNAVLTVNFSNDINFAGVVRAANAFGVGEVIQYSNKTKYDRRGCVGCYHYTDVRTVKSISEIEQLKEKYKFVVFELLPESVSIYDFLFPSNSLFITGSEGDGIPEEILNMADYKVYIPIDRGTIRSLNTAMTANIAMAYYNQQYPYK